MNLSNEFHGLKFYAGIKEAACEQRYIENQSSNENIVHQTSNVTLNLSYSFGKGDTNDRKHTVRSFYLQSERDYNNHRDMEKLAKFHKIKSIKYIRDYEGYGKVNLNISNQILKESHTIRFDNTNFDTEIDDEQIQFNAEYAFTIDNISLSSAYKREDSFFNYSGGLEYSPDFSGMQGHKFKRSSNGYSAAIKFVNNQISYPIDLENIQFSFFHEQIKDHLPPSLFADRIEENSNSEWHESSYMFSSALIGGNNDLFFKSHFNYSVNFRIPTIYQQVTSLMYPVNNNWGSKLQTEYKVNYEVGTSIFSNFTGALNISQSEISCVIFNSSYKNKFRMIQLGGTPLTLLDNYKDANIFGVETYISTELKKMCSLYFSYIKYIIPDKAAFPFKPESKLTSKLVFDFRGLNIDLIYYKESQRAGWIINYISDNSEMTLQELILEKYGNIDVHIKKTVEVWRLKWFLSASGRNLINNSLALQGIAIRDRRFYLTIGLEFE